MPPNYRPPIDEKPGPRIMEQDQQEEGHPDANTISTRDESTHPPDG